MARALAWMAAAAMAASIGCGDAGDDVVASEQEVGEPKAGVEAADDPELTPEQLVERPWEVLSNKGETYLSNVFYAEPEENEQIMPWAVDGRAVIDRLVYPTIGNPNLYVKGDADDELVMVLRIEDDAYAHLLPRLAPASGAAPRELTLKEDERDGFAFFLVGRAARASATESSGAATPGSSVFRVRPSKVLVNAEPEDMPAALRRRHTVRFVFDQGAMKDVPAGLYDARFEVRKAGEVYANVFEYQYNAVRVFDRPEEEYTALNVTDTQVSVAAVYKTLTAEKIDDFVDAVNASTASEVRSAAFITFNGDLHNGGSPETIRQRGVATTYNQEAKRVLSALKRLTLPIFLTPGNHDGYASLGHVPSAVASADNLVGDSLRKVVEEQNNKAWPEFTWDAYAAFLAKTDAKREGLHHDLYTGGFRRAPGDGYGEAWAEVPRGQRNVLLYDGFYQWQKTYGPLYGSWTFGKNRYVSMNSYELRQHRRTGWGMYTVNYGGAIGQVQMAWLDRELARAKGAAEDVVILLHHDPRGGHKGKDAGYYFPLLEYRSVQQSTVNYLLSEVFTPLVCKQADWSLSVDERASCLHDGLQEWMAPDEEFERTSKGVFLSGVELLRRVAKNPHVRTLLIGHAHFNTLEVLQEGEPLVPGGLTLGDPASQKRVASLEAANPVRRFSWEARLEPEAVLARGGELDLEGTHRFLPGDTLVTPSSFDGWRARLDGMLRAATPPALRTLSGGASGPRELAVLRLTSAADLSSQKYGGASMYGWSVLHVTKGADVPRINAVTYLIHSGAGGGFSEIKRVDLDRTRSIPARGPENPVDQLFDW